MLAWPANKARTNRATTFQFQWTGRGHFDRPAGRNIYAARPGLVIGRRGAEAESLRRADAGQVEHARSLQPIDERSLPFGKTVMLFDGVPGDQLTAFGETRTPGLADLFVAIMKGTYA